MEGFNLSLLEAVSHGDIGITYDVNYGPDEIINDGENGYVVPNGDYHALAERIVYVLKHNRISQQLSKNAYNSTRRYSENEVWNKWQ